MSIYSLMTRASKSTNDNNSSPASASVWLGHARRKAHFLVKKNQGNYLGFLLFKQILD
jgi:hypothetical protein